MPSTQFADRLERGSAFAESRFPRRETRVVIGGEELPCVWSARQTTEQIEDGGIVYNVDASLNIRKSIMPAPPERYTTASITGGDALRSGRSHRPNKNASLGKPISEYVVLQVQEDTVGWILTLGQPVNP